MMIELMKEYNQNSPIPNLKLYCIVIVVIDKRIDVTKIFSKDNTDSVVPCIPCFAIIDYFFANIVRLKTASLSPNLFTCDEKSMGFPLRSKLRFK